MAVRVMLGARLRGHDSWHEKGGRRLSPTAHPYYFGVVCGAGPGGGVGPTGFTTGGGLPPGAGTVASWPLAGAADCGAGPGGAGAGLGLTTGGGAPPGAGTTAWPYASVALEMTRTAAQRGVLPNRIGCSLSMAASLPPG
jgi:hypothetical protein